MSRQHTLGAKERLKSRKQIDALFTGGARLTVSPLRVFYSIAGEPVPIRFGVGVSSKAFRRAVDRNRIKRLIRECWRLQKLPLQQACSEKGTGLQVFVIYTAKEMPAFQELSARVQKVITHLLAELVKN